MKQSLGRIGVWWLLMLGSVHAAQYEWSVVKAPSQLYVGESGLVQYRCLFDNSAADYTVVFKPEDAKNYQASMVTQNDHVSNGKRMLTFDVLITPNAAGIVEVKQRVLIRHTTFASIENATIGRDNVRKYDFNDEKVQMPRVTIRAMANTADLSGEITLAVQVDKVKVRSHEPVHLSLFVRGRGNLHQFVPYELNISGVKGFSEPAHKELSLGERGYEGEIRQEFALVAEKSYVIPPFSLSVFDTKTHTSKILRSQPITIEVEKGYVPGNLLDAHEISDYTVWKRYGMYGLFILLGIILGEVSRRLWRYRPQVEKRRAFWDSAATEKELSVLLSLRGDIRYADIIRMLDEGIVNVDGAKKKLRALISVHEGKR
ncbi:MAG: BatD family protein [Sulfuricurvum sp.]|nr:BatD family protein [Sulfuricurvum sp.]